MAKRRRLGEILTEAGLITETQLSAALSSQRTWGGKLGSTLTRMGFVGEDDILKCLSSQLKLPCVDFDKVKISSKALDAIPLRVAEKYNVIPVAIKEEHSRKSLILAMSDPTNLEVLREIQFQLGVDVRPIVATESAIARAIDHYYRGKPGPGTSGHQRRVELASLGESEEMVILPRGEEEGPDPVEALGAKELVTLLIDVLEGKGVVSKEELEEALRRSR